MRGVADTERATKRNAHRGDTVPTYAVSRGRGRNANKLSLKNGIHQFGLLGDTKKAEWEGRNGKRGQT